ncbi:MAG: alpha-amylase family glycosyl hydrolase, partial [Planktothrix sp.]
QLNLLDSHDTARLITIAGGDKASVELATLLLFTFPGAPSIYYGDEVGLEGHLDPDSRRSFPMQDSWDQDILDYHKKLIAIRHQYPALRTGYYQILYAEDMVYGFARYLENEELIVIVNSGTESAEINVTVTDLKTRPNQLIYGAGKFSWKQENHTTELVVYLPPRQGIILANC